MQTKDIKKFFIIQYIIIGLLVIVCLFLVIDKYSNREINSAQESAKNDYDISMMNELTVSEVLDLFEDGKTHVLYIGRATCGVCKSILPNLQAAQDNFNYITQYLDITKADRNSSDWEKFEKLLDVETSMSVTNADGEKELLAETYGYFVGTYGYTPTLIIIDDNKMIAGHIGNFSLSDLEKWLQNNGIS